MNTTPTTNHVMEALRTKWLAGFTAHEACGRVMGDKYTPMLKHVAALFSKWEKESAIQDIKV